MLSVWDDLPIHQTPATLDQPASSDPAVYERFYFSFFAVDGSTMVSLVVNLHPNKGIADAGFSVSEGGVHESLFITAATGPGRGLLECGPLSLHFLEPMRTLRVILDETDGFAADITINAVGPGLEEPRVTRVRDNRVVQDRSRYVQLGRPTGSVVSPLGTHSLSSEAWRSARDHSWGIWDAPKEHARSARGHDLSFLWLIGTFDDLSVQAVTHADEHDVTYGQYASSAPNLASGERGEAERAQRTHDDVAFTTVFPTDRWHLESGVMTLDPDSPEPTEVAFRSIHEILPHSVGYDHPTWSYGTVFPSLPHIVRQRWDWAHEDLLDRQNHRALQAIELTRADGAIGYGVIDQRVSRARAENESSR